MKKITTTSAPGMTKRQRYEALLPQLRSLVEDEPDPIANMANIATVLAEEFGWWWTGFYRVIGDRLVLGPYRGPLACTTIPYGRGVCGTAWARGRTIIVPDVELFEGHIACSSASRSEIVVPIRDIAGAVRGVIDIDATELSAFDAVDAEYLEQIAPLIRL